MVDYTQDLPTKQFADAPRANCVGKRIVVCCDGTWQDALSTTQSCKFSNVLRIARALNHMDHRVDPPIHQVVFYQSGIGTENFYDSVVDGVTGATLAYKVEEAYGFIALNYHLGDEIFLFGFSRGAYTARMVAMFIGAIGVLDRTQMDHFASIFLAYQKRGKAEDTEEIRKLDEELAPWRSPDAPGKMRANSELEGFTVKVVGVFDTVGSLGLPGELTLRSEKPRTIFGFPDRLLGHHVERAYHAMAINETRKDFDCAKFEQTDEGRRKGQILKQCWFAGSHCDVGGGYEHHDLSDIAMNWLVANIQDVLSFDYDYIASLPRPETKWGSQAYHNSREGMYSLLTEYNRPLPIETDDITHEVIHSSVLQQPHPTPQLSEVLRRHPSIVTELLLWEEQMKNIWENKLLAESKLTTPTSLETSQASQGVAVSVTTRELNNHHSHTHEVIHEALEAVKVWDTVTGKPEGRPHGDVGYVKDWLGKMVA